MGLLDKLIRKTVHTLSAPVAGTAVSADQIPDPAFSGGMLGKGVAIKPVCGRICAPCDATVDMVFTSGHAVSLIAGCGAEILIHVGLGTVALNGRGFTVHVRSGQAVKRGDLLIEADLDAIRAAGLDPITPMLVSNASEYTDFCVYTGQDVTYSDVVVQLSK